MGAGTEVDSIPPRLPRLPSRSGSEEVPALTPRAAWPPAAVTLVSGMPRSSLSGCEQVDPVVRPRTGWTAAPLPSCIFGRSRPQPRPRLGVLPPECCAGGRPEGSAAAGLPRDRAASQRTRRGAKSPGRKTWRSALRLRAR